MGPLLQALRDPGSRQVIVSEVRDFYRAGDFKQLAGMVGALGPLDTVYYFCFFCYKDVIIIIISLSLYMYIHIYM